MAYFVMKYKVYPLSITPFLLTSASLCPSLFHSQQLYSQSLFEHHKRNYEATHLFDFGALLLAVQTQLTTARTDEEKKV